MAKLASVCTLLGFLIVPLSIGCSTTPQTGFPGGPGTGGTNNQGGGASTGGAPNFQVTVTPDKLKQLLLTCGNGKLDPNEQCDDGNTVGGDGCSSTCQWENPN